MNQLTKGCTLISWLAAMVNVVLPEEGCCEEHDLFYEQGGPIRTKIFADWLLARCVVLANPGWQGWAKAALGWLVVSFNPYAWVVWLRK